MLNDGDYRVSWPSFVHEFGDRFHHMSLTRTIEIDEEGDFIPGTGPPEWHFKIHEFLDDVVFYPITHWLTEYIGDNDTYSLLRGILAFFWGFNCGFPAEDIVRYTAWYFRGCKATWTKLS